MRKSFFHIILIALLGLLVYSNTFDVPFQWDEDLTIIDNPIVKDLRFFVHPSEARGIIPDYYSFRDRYVGYLSFALNYRLHGLDVRGYHVVNITLHILNSLLVYALVRLTLRTPALNPSPSPPAPLPKGEGGRRPGEGVALFVALIFVSHPIQTEAVTYIMGRLPLLMWFSYLSSMVLYAKWRLTSLTLNPSPTGRGQGVRVILYLLSLLSAVLAMKTKENAFTLPFSIALYEFLFFKVPRPLPHPYSLSLWERVAGGRVRGYRLLYLAPFMLTLLIIPLSLMSFDRPIGEAIGGIESASRHYTAIPRMSYFLTQFRVLVTYLRLLFLPINQNFDYHYPLFSSFFAPEVFISFLFLLSIFCFGVYLLYRSYKIGNPALRLLAWGIFWFFLTLSVESSIFPIPMIISEYRLYAPSMGMILAVIATSFIVSSNRLIMPALIVVTLALSAAAYARNIVWGSNISLWEDVVKKSPENSRGYNNLGKLYRAKGLIDRAMKHYEAALKLNPYNAEAHNNLGDVYGTKGLFDKSMEQFQIALRLKPDYVDAHYNLGTVYFSKGLADKAMEHYKIALGLKPNFAEAHFNLGLIYIDKGLEDMARSEFEAALQINPNYHRTRQWLNYLSNQDKSFRYKNH